MPRGRVQTRRVRGVLEKGRLLEFAWTHADRELRHGTKEAESWGPYEFEPLGLDFLSEVQSVARMTRSVALEKLKILTKLPYLLARWGQGIKDQAIEQWESVPPSNMPQFRESSWQRGHNCVSSSIHALRVTLWRNLCSFQPFVNCAASLWTTRGASPPTPAPAEQEAPPGDRRGPG